MAISDGPLSSLAFCWIVERPDGAGLALTSHDADLLVDGRKYRASPGMLPSAVIRGSGLDPQTSDVEGALSSPALSEEDLIAGRWDEARMELTAIDWSDPGAGKIELTAGEIGELSLDGDHFSAELRGAASRLEAPLCPETSPQCRATFGDHRCRVDLAGRSVRAMVVAIDGVELTLDRPVDARYAFGRLRWLGGAIAGLQGMVLSASGTTTRLREAPRASFSLPLPIELRQGCDKLFATCSGRFANSTNFRGEPHLPGNDLLTRYPGGNG